MKIMHLAQPGPLYWDFKCLRCDGLVSDHANAFQVAWHAIKDVRHRS